MTAEGSMLMIFSVGNTNSMWELCDVIFKQTGQKSLEEVHRGYKHTLSF